MCDDPTARWAQQRHVMELLQRGDSCLELGDYLRALEYYQGGLEISQQLAVDLTDLEAQRMLSVSYQKLGDVHLNLGHLDEARSCYQQCLDIREPLAHAASATGLQAMRDLCVAYDRLGLVAHMQLEFDTAMENYRASIDILSRMLELGVDVESTEALLQLVERHLETAEQAQRLNEFDQRGIDLRELA